MSWHSAETCDLEMPVMPSAWTRSSTLRVDTPWIQASWIQGGERLPGGLAGFQKGWKVGPLAQLRDLQVERAEPGFQLTLAIAVAGGGALVGAFMAPGADPAIDLELHPPLERVGGDGAQEVAVGTGLDLVEQKCHRILGHHASRPRKPKERVRCRGQCADRAITGQNCLIAFFL